MKRRLLVGLAGLLLVFPVSGVPSLLDEGRAAEAAENYQRAVELYRQAQEADPEDPEPTRALAELFTVKGLHDLALPVWQELVRRSPGDPAAWHALAQTWSYLDKNAESVNVLEEAADRFPDDADGVQALAWMLFKTEEFRRGVDLLERYTAVHGSDRGLEMTLGTLYSSLYEYDLSRIHYLKCLDLSRGNDVEAANFRSIAWYNLSLLEKSFYQFELSDQAILRSLAEEDRPAGSLARGELFQGRMDFAEAKRLYDKAAADDETPLGRFDLARLLQQFGRLDEAEAQLDQVERHRDVTWIYNYGVTKDKLKRDLHEARADLHRARFHHLNFAVRATPWDWALWLWAKAREGFQWWYHDQSWKALLVNLSNTSLAVRNSPDAWVGLTLAHRDRPTLALKYLFLVRNHELPRNPRAHASYLVEEGIISRDPEILEKALTRLTVPWENEDRERALAALAEIRRGQGRTAEVRRLLTQWYQLNPGGLPIRGWGVPVRVAVFGDEAVRKFWQAAWADYAAQTGWDAGPADRPGVRWTLDLRVEAGTAAWTLRDGEGETVRSGLVRKTQEGLPAAVAALFWQVHEAR